MKDVGKGHTFLEIVFFFLGKSLPKGEKNKFKGIFSHKFYYKSPNCDRKLVLGGGRGCHQIHASLLHIYEFSK